MIALFVICSHCFSGYLVSRPEMTLTPKQSPDAGSLTMASKSDVLMFAHELPTSATKTQKTPRRAHNFVIYCLFLLGSQASSLDLFQPLV
jgi:hypothetical protein